MTAKTLMVMGTGSSVGKSLLVAALCRIFARRGLRVAPFKAQNMSNNAAVCAGGEEIGRAQAVQARAAGLEPCADMNPVLLKPEGHTRSQVIVLGRPWETLQASRYYERKSTLWPIVTAALDRLRADSELVVIEGAGSPVELNLKDGDIVNMAVARYAQSPVLLVGDIDKGGIFAQLLGTLWLMAPEERALVRGLVVNKFRGDQALFMEGLRILESRGEVPVLGVIPFIADLAIPEEDAVALDAAGALPHMSPLTPQPSPLTPALDIAIIRLPHIANFDDFDPLAREAGVRVRYVHNAAALGSPHALVLPGTKSTMADLVWLREQGLDREIQRLAGEGVAVTGICGGFQMLGQVLRDPDGVESRVRDMPGLGLLPVETTFAGAKVTGHVRALVQGGSGWLDSARGQTVAGYEIHMGRSVGGRPWLEIEPRDSSPRPDGAASPDGKIWGCYPHGLFANAPFRRAWLGSLAPGNQKVWDAECAEPQSKDLDAALDDLANVVEAALDVGQLREMLGKPDARGCMP